MCKLCQSYNNIIIEVKIIQCNKGSDMTTLIIEQMLFKKRKSFSVIKDQIKEH